MLLSSTCCSEDIGYLHSEFALLCRVSFERQGTKAGEGVEASAAVSEEEDVKAVVSGGYNGSTEREVDAGTKVLAARLKSLSREWVSRMAECWQHHFFVSQQEPRGTVNFDPCASAASNRPTNRTLAHPMLRTPFPRHGNPFSFFANI